MAYKIYNTRDWGYEKIASYSSDLTQAFKDLVAKFPDDLSLHQLAYEIAIGRQDLWLILDEEEKFKAFLTTEVSCLNSGRRRLTLCQLAGSGGVDLVDVLPQIEHFAAAQGIEEICPIGRVGWQKKLAEYGYRPVIFKYRKEIVNVGSNLGKGWQ